MITIQVQSGIHCPICGAKTYVSHTTNRHDGVKRYRRCKICGYNFQTHEK